MPGPIFRHQRYTREPDVSSVEFVRAVETPRADTAEFRQQMAAIGSTLVTADVARLVLIHGTFVGTDPTGLATAARRFSPRMADGLEWFAKAVADTILGERGNYPQQMIDRMTQWLSIDSPRMMPVERFLWSGENHHLGRLDGAVRLIDHLTRQPLEHGTRRMLVGHSHGGNVLALTTQLLVADPGQIETLFAATERFWHSGRKEQIDLEYWPRVRDWLLAGHGPELAKTLDMVSVGAPIRYGWNSQGCGRLLHIMSHRPRPTAKSPYYAGFPLRRDEWLRGSQGDVIALLGIAGTNFAPLPLVRRAWQVDHILAELLQGEVEPYRQWGRWKTGPRIHDTGHNLLVDFGVQSWNVFQHGFGHAVYTRTSWMPWLYGTMVSRLYGDEPAAG